jgi:2-polyprenyl-3-methyl-5-hydroxy-6-metoxy-1,4-benzoquinol methylase
MLPRGLVKSSRKALDALGLGEPAARLWHAFNARLRYAELLPRRLTPQDCPAAPGDCPSMGRRKGGEKIGRVFSSCAFRCSECGLVYFDPQPDPESLKTFYSAEGSTGYAQLLHGWTAKSLDQEEVARHSSKLEELRSVWRDSDPQAPSPSAPPIRFLEVGIGNSHLLVVARDQKGWRVSGIDVSRPLVEEARSRHGLDIHEIDLSIGSTELPPASFDIIYSAHALEHTRFPGNVLAQMAKLVSPNGIVVVEVPNGQSLHALRGFSTWPWGNYPEHLYFFSKKAFEMACERVGLTCEMFDSKSSDSDVSLLHTLLKNSLGSDSEIVVGNYLPGLRQSLLLSELRLVARKKPR